MAGTLVGREGVVDGAETLFKMEVDVAGTRRWNRVRRTWGGEDDTYHCKIQLRRQLLAGWKENATITHGPASSVTKLNRRSLELLGKVSDWQHTPNGCFVAEKPSDTAIIVGVLGRHIIHAKGRLFAVLVSSAWHLIWNLHVNRVIANPDRILTAAEIYNQWLNTITEHYSRTAF
ncbi:hypothetical protein B0H14DRAFT_2611421 [Mycena olivaceomarginata]|nr:hypothetical protein B0H14DRAFT_2611421 [Mycena olivaceomarginata]